MQGDEAGDDEVWEVPFTALAAESLPRATPTPFDVMERLASFSGPFAPTGARDTVLLVSTAHDTGADAVAHELARRGLLICRLNVETIGTSSSLSVGVDERGAFTGRIAIEAGSFDTNEIRSAWVRRPFYGLLGRELPRNWMGSFAWRERESALRSLFELLTNCFWLSSPSSLASANAKLAQLRAAAAVGLSIPDTLVTDDPQAARTFYEKHRGAVIVKAFRGELGASVAGDTRLIYTRRVRSEDLDSLEAVRHAPCIFQEHVPKSTELRVTIVGKRVFPVEIRASEEIDDWRRPSSTVTYEAVTLAPEIEAACLSLMARWDLSFGALDLIQRPDGTIVFLELNTHAEWLWLEHATGLPVTTAIADLLQHGLPG